MILVEKTLHYSEIAWELAGVKIGRIQKFLTELWGTLLENCLECLGDSGEVINKAWSGVGRCTDLS